jgi:very-short-patch-repair endonuclease
MTKGGLQKKVYLTIFGVIKILQSSKKINIIDFYDKIGLNKETLFHFPPIECETLNMIIKSFNGENMIKQYVVLNYRVDLYLSDYNICIECDEPQHEQKIYEDIEREVNIITYLNSVHKFKCIFIRYKPFDKDFCIFNVINQIYKQIINNKIVDKI